MTKKLNLIGCRFGRLQVTGPHPNINKHTAWECLCDCGKSTIVITNQLRSGFTRSCGCLGRERRIERNTKHGLSRRGNKTLEYNMWCAAKKRAKERGLDFEITPSDIIIPKSCPVFGVTLSQGIVTHHPESPTVDRKDPARGYTRDNIWVISYRANRIKNDASLQELQTLVRVLEEIAHHDS